MEQNAQGTLVPARGDLLRVRTQGPKPLKLRITDARAVTLNGQTSPAAQLKPGSDVRASQTVDGQAKALTIQATSTGSGQPQGQKQG